MQFWKELPAGAKAGVSGAWASDPEPRVPGAMCFSAPHLASGHPAADLELRNGGICVTLGK